MKGKKMAIKKYKSTTNGRRNMTTIDYKKVLTTDKPEKSLVTSLNKKSGHNNQGHITTRHKGGGHKRKYRIIDFKRNKFDVIGKVATVEYDPNRNAFISLINYVDGEKRYILTPKGLSVGMSIVSALDADIKVGNALPLKNIPDGTLVHNVELKPGKGGQMARSAGASVQIVGRDETTKYTILRLSSGEVRKVLSECLATIGVVGNEEHNLIN